MDIFSRWRRCRRRPQGIVLAYHRVADLSVDPWDLAVRQNRFVEHLETIRDGWRPLSLAQLLEWNRSGRGAENAVAVTFDDGYADNLHAARPLLERFAIPATFYLATGGLGEAREFWWDTLERIFLHGGELPTVLEVMVRGESLRWTLAGDESWSIEEAQRHASWKADQPPPTSRHRAFCELWQRLFALHPADRHGLLMQLLAWCGGRPEAGDGHQRLQRDQVGDLVAGELFGCGGHSVSHSPMTQLNEADQRAEIVQCRWELERLSGGPVDHFSYPHGSHDAATRSLVAELGFASACTTERARVLTSSSRHQLPRLVVRDWSGQEFAEQLAQVSSGDR